MLSHKPSQQMSSPAYRDETSHGKGRPAAATACEACRKLKVSISPFHREFHWIPLTAMQMKCTRTAPQEHENSLSEACDRCKRTNRPCKVPESRPLGRRRGALGRYRGLEKAYRKLQAEAKKANLSHGLEEVYDSVALPTDENLAFDSFLTNESDPPRFSATSEARAAPGTPFLGPEVRTPGTVIQADHREDVEVQVEPTQEPMSNPLALLAFASDAAQATETSPASVNALTSPASRRQSDRQRGETEGHRLLHRPGYVSLGLQLDRASLVEGLDTLLDSADAGYQALDYFKRTGVRQRDVGPDLDPVELGLVTMEDAHHLFPMYVFTISLLQVRLICLDILRDYTLSTGYLTQCSTRQNPSVVFLRFCLPGSSR